MKRKKPNKSLGLLFVMGLLLLGWKNTTEAAWEDNPYISLSPDGEAYTTQAGVKETEWYEYGTKVHTGVQPTISALQEGEHIYSYKMDGLVPVKTWVVTQQEGLCIHKKYPVENTFHGVNFGRRVCHGSYFSGWLPLCANCNEVVVVCFFYMSDEAAASMQYIDMSKAYYYKCPHCNNLEQALEHPSHTCKNVSKNRYFVCYDANQGTGYMGKSVHMYDNATLYEGREVTPQTTLSLNTFRRKGYIFAGWNTKADGSGEFFEEGETIYNLAKEEGAQVVLYAQWKECSSTLEIDPAGGVYRDRKEITKQTGLYGESFVVASEQLVAPVGYTVEFDTQGGKYVAPVQGTKEWKEWKKEGSFSGELQENTYVFPAQDGAVDRISAVYTECSVVLPLPDREGYSFGGWYLDKECTKRIGTAGDKFTPGKDVVLYAGWVELQLQSTANYSANSGRGAVDLIWKQKDSADKLYTIHQRKIEGEWGQVLSEQKNNTYYETAVEILFSGEEEIYTIPYTGIYHFKLYGAQGGNYKNYNGGRGGYAEADVFLEKGDRLHCIIGGQNGYGGGGSAVKYGVGGGATSVYSEKYGMLLVAGGGGGAWEYVHGLPGGSAQNVVEGKNGEIGESGGGGGYQGGKSGEALRHYHDSACMHVHVGTPDTPGGCYILPVACGNTEFAAREVDRFIYYGNIEEQNGEWVHVFCVRCGSYECNGHLHINYKYVCTKCGKEYDTQVNKCTGIGSYAPDCDGTLLCSYEEGEILEVRAAAGGSNYINKEYCINYLEKEGVRSGNGMLQITAEIIGVLEENEADGISAPDLAAPEKVSEESVSITGLSEKEVRVAFQKPKDNGTVYYHMVQSYDVKTNKLICSSNTTEDTIITGVAGYYYVIDGNAGTEVNKTHSYYAEVAETPFIMVEIKSNIQYLHVAAVDKAGNLGATSHIRIAAEEISYWPLITEKIVLRQWENVKKTSEQDTYFVKADGVTPFEIECEGLVCGNASSKYQITHMSICTWEENGIEGLFTVITPMQGSLEEGVTTYPMHLLRKKTEGMTNITDGGYTVTKRYNYGKNLLWIQQFVIPKEADGQILCLIPQAAVQTNNGFVYSDKVRDSANGIRIIADANGPQMEGLEQLEEMEYLDFSNGEKMQIHLRSRDDGSGLYQFYVEINNMDNNTIVRYDDTQLTGEIVFEVSGEDMVFNGEFQIMVYARDAVGNETVEGVRLQGVGLQAYVERILEPHDAMFKRGESGILHIQTTGYVERVEVSFPQDMLREGESGTFTYVYRVPRYIKTEKLQFMVPLTAADGTKTIQVKAYKNGTELEKQPQFISIHVKGSILDELRTRLR